MFIVFKDNYTAYIDKNQVLFQFLTEKLSAFFIKNISFYPAEEPAFYMLVDFRAYEQHIHTEIQPQHEKNDCRKAAVKHRIAREPFNVDREQI